MGFYLRKSVKVGPFRFNLSKSGVGVSGGVKGLRIGSGPRGNYIHMGRGGLYYRKTIGGGDTGSRHSGDGHREELPVGESEPMEMVGASMVDVDSACVSQMAHASSVDLLRELNEKEKISRIGPLVVSIGVALLFLALASSVHPALIVILAAFVATTSFFAFQRDSVAKSVVLFYNLDPTIEHVYGELHEAVSWISQCKACWHVAAAGEIHDKRYHGGASKALDRKITTVSSVDPHFLKTNIKSAFIQVGRQKMYFFPDRIFVYDVGMFGAVGYDEISIKVSQSKFIEEDPPSDAQIVDYTWKYVNKSGSPDKRFSNNKRLPICLYEEIHFFSESGLNEIIQVSRTGFGQKLEQAIRQLARYTAG